ncbi:MAG: hypothetical protein B7Z80_01875 [Rhodospirillales bacterium 20-64-7]|nr:MAG: hypothetical protein B7Z80_01875 [Rhodospirillales bacterium 20-64-7]HQT75769.1 TVP38/TMEM64 family protein [Rhodopila sp.]
MAPPLSHRAWIVRALTLLGVAGLIGGFFVMGFQHDLTLDSLRAHEHDLLALRDQHPVTLAAGYLLLYVVMAALSIPGALVVTVAGGAVFGLLEGAVLASFGSSLGATLAFLASRFLFRGPVRQRFQSRVDQVNHGLDRDGWIYLLSLRLVPAIPFFLVNLVFGVTAFPVLRFYTVSQIGMFPATLVYVNAGTQIEHLKSLSGILSPWMIGSLLLLAVLPFAARAVTRHLIARR